MALFSTAEKTIHTIHMARVYKIALAHSPCAHQSNNLWSQTSYNLSLLAWKKQEIPVWVLATQLFLVIQSPFHLSRSKSSRFAIGLTRESRQAFANADFLFPHFPSDLSFGQRVSILLNIFCQLSALFK